MGLDLLSTGALTTQPPRKTCTNPNFFFIYVFLIRKCFVSNKKKSQLEDLLKTWVQQTNKPGYQWISVDLFC